MSISLLSLYQLISKELGYAQGVASGNGASGGTTLLDTSGDSPMQTDQSAKKYQNWHLMIEALSSGTSNLGEVRRVTTYTPSSQTLTVGAFTAQTTSTHTYGLYVVPPTRVETEKGLDEYINETLRALHYWDDVLITAVTDGDMETSGVTNWTVVDQSAATKSTSTGVVKGSQALRTQNSSANGYARPAAISVTEGQVWDVCVDVTPAAGSSAKLQTWDATASAEIDVTDAYDGAETGRLWLSSSIPTDCESLQIRLIGVEAAADVYWDNLSVRNTSTRWFTLPSWFIDDGWLDYTWLWRPGTRRNVAYAVEERRKERVWWHEVEVDHTANAPYRLVIPGTVPSGTHLFAHCARPYGEFTHSGANLTASTTDADQDWVKAWVLAKIFYDKGDKPQYERWLGEAMRWHQMKQAVVEPRLKFKEAW